MMRLFDMLLGLPQGPMCFWGLAGKGRAVSVYTKDYSNLLSIKLERKIESGDVKEGKLVPISQESVKRRGGKRSLTFKISLESAEALHATLGRALREKRREQFSTFLTENLLQMVWVMVVKQRHRLANYR